jgi:hypothetical protein
MVNTSARPSAAAATALLPLRRLLGTAAPSPALTLLKALPTLLLLLLSVLLLRALRWLLLPASGAACCSSSVVLKLLAPMLLVLRMLGPSLPPAGDERLPAASASAPAPSGCAASNAAGCGLAALLDGRTLKVTPPTNSFTTAMLFSVSVPVLSLRRRQQHSSSEPNINGKYMWVQLLSQSHPRCA